MIPTPINKSIVDKWINELKIKDVGKASIREIKRLVNQIENETGVEFIRMEMGIPGLPTPQIAIEAEKKALDKGVTAIYPEIEGLPELKEEISKFAKLFLGINVPPNCCVPTVGSINGAYASFMTAGRRDPLKDTILFLDPGFPVHKQLVKMLGLKQISVDVYNYRGEKLRSKLESILQSGNISIILYSNPNNPTWICFSEKELKIIAELANKYDVIVTEDLAYFGMDFRKDISVPGEPPFQPTIANYTDNYILLISSSKSFSYAGQRIAMLIISPILKEKPYEGLLQYFNSPYLGHALIFGALYGTTAGVSHTAQYGLAALLKATNERIFNFILEAREYELKAKIAKQIFLSNGFRIVYDMDDDVPIGDGFYFTISYPGFTGDELIKEFLYYGISAISLSTTGSERIEGIRACVSLIRRDQFPVLEKRLAIFKQNHPTS